MTDSQHKTLKKLKTDPFSRNMSMAKIGLVAGSQIATHATLNLFRSKESRSASDAAFYTRQAEYLRDELGQLKGSIMKVGQMLSLYGQYFMPPDAVDILASLQDNTPPVDWDYVRPQLEDALGAKRIAELDINPMALASASLGQVHTAIRKADGKKLCIKIQYPGVGDAIDSDIRSLSRIIQLARVMPKGISLGPIMEEVREMLHQEVDYRREAMLTQWFANKLADDPRYVVPTVLTEYCADTVLTTTFEQAEHVRSPAVQQLAQERRNQLSESALQLFLREFLHWQRVQTDPHFGNYKVRIDPQGKQDQLVLIDFGATRDYASSFVSDYRDVIGGALDDDRERVIRGAEGIGLMRTQFGDSVLDAFVEVCRLIIEPFREQPPAEYCNADGAYQWGETDLPSRVGKAVARAAMSRYFRVPPREIVFLHRRLAGVFILLASLNAETQSRGLLLDVLAGVSVPAEPTD